MLPRKRASMGYVCCPIHHKLKYISLHKVVLYCKVIQVFVLPLPPPPKKKEKRERMNCIKQTWVSV